MQVSHTTSFFFKTGLSTLLSGIVIVVVSVGYFWRNYFIFSQIELLLKMSGAEMKKSTAKKKPTATGKWARHLEEYVQRVFHRLKRKRWSNTIRMDKKISSNWISWLWSVSVSPIIFCVFCGCFSFLEQSTIAAYPISSHKSRMSVFADPL